jgi:hypothetical protein
MINNRFFLGADPGTVGGCIAVIDAVKNEVMFFDMPLTHEKKHDSNKLYEYLLSFEDCAIVVESVCFSDRDEFHKGSAEKLIRSHEAIITCASIAKLQVRQMTTSEWRKLAGSYFLGTDEQKICEFAAILYPGTLDRLIEPKKRGKGYIYKHNRAEALLMAHCAKLIYQQAVDYAAKIRNLPPANRDRPTLIKGVAID